MARVEVDPNYTGPTFSRATAGTDLFKKEDVQQLAAAVSTHVHDGVHGLGVAPAAATIPGSALTNGSVTLAKLAADSVDSSKIVDGTIATADLANSSVTNAKLASDTARANLLTNGGFEVWQRGTTGLTSAFTADRWQTAWGAGGSMTVNRDSANADGAAGYCAAYSYTHGSAQTNVYQTVENVLELKGKTVTLSIRVRCAVASGVRARIWNGSAEVLSAFHTGDGTYQTLTVTTTIPAGSTALYVGIALFVSGTYYLDNAMLVVGSVPADYAPLHPADDLARCLRYYESSLSDNYVASGAAFSTTSAEFVYVFKATKAVMPTITFGAASGFAVRDATAGNVVPTAMSTTVAGISRALLSATVASGLTQGRAVSLSASPSNVIVEANP